MTLAPILVVPCAGAWVGIRGCSHGGLADRGVYGGCLFPRLLPIGAPGAPGGTGGNGRQPRARVHDVDHAALAPVGFDGRCLGRRHPGVAVDAAAHSRTWGSAAAVMWHPCALGRNHTSGDSDHQGFATARTPSKRSAGRLSFHGNDVCVFRARWAETSSRNAGAARHGPGPVQLCSLLRAGKPAVGQLNRGNRVPLRNALCRAGPGSIAASRSDELSGEGSAFGHQRKQYCAPICSGHLPSPEMARVPDPGPAAADSARAGGGPAC